MLHQIEAPDGKYGNSDSHRKSLQAIAISQTPIARL